MQSSECLLHLLTTNDLVYVVFSLYITLEYTKEASLTRANRNQCFIERNNYQRIARGVCVC